MKQRNFYILAILITCLSSICFTLGDKSNQHKAMKFNPLTDQEKNIILNKGTEYPGTGVYLYHKQDGTYTCKQCNAPLYRSSDKFDSHCGWPSFDDEIEGAIRHQTDADGRRTEILCANCGAHLGHIFEGEEFTPKNVRHCVNSLSLNFKADDEHAISKAYFASGCFWGTQYYFNKLSGVISTNVGYMGGDVEAPTYEQVCRKDTGHFESIEILYNPSKVSYGELVRYFFETHDFSQENGQGPDIGSQYRSAIFYSSDEEQTIAEQQIDLLKKMGYHVATLLLPYSTFWEAEDYHQDYYEKKGSTPYCHRYTKIF